MRRMDFRNQQLIDQDWHGSNQNIQKPKKTLSGSTR